MSFATPIPWNEEVKSIQSMLGTWPRFRSTTIEWNQSDKSLRLTAEIEDVTDQDAESYAMETFYNAVIANIAEPQQSDWQTFVIGSDVTH